MLTLDVITYEDIPIDDLEDHFDYLRRIQEFLDDHYVQIDQ